MASQRPSLPEFDNPPVTEVIISIEFSSLAAWRGPHAGVFWSQIIKEYPTTEVHPPLPTQLERFGDTVFQAPVVQIEMMNPDNNRVWFLSDPSNYLIQVQKNRFIFNWRKIKGDEAYPRYDKEIRPRFLKEWQRFQKFVREQSLGTIEVQQSEVTYINDILRGEGWNSFGESLTLLANWTPKAGGYLPPPETLSMAGAFRMPDDHGRLHFIIQHVQRAFDQREAVQIRLTARGRPETISDENVLSWIDTAHEWVVLSFVDLTSKTAQELWRRTR